MSASVPPGDAPQRWWRARPQSWWWTALIVLIPVIVTTGLAAWVLRATTHVTLAADQIDLVKTALATGAGTGGVITLILAGRRQWHTEQAHLGTEHDATQRRITELYTKAADQLGSDKAAVRLAGLYALERLAQDNPSQRLTIVNVLCAYLRMPYTPPPDTAPALTAPEPEHLRFETLTQERQVRLAAQRILAIHLRPGDDPTHPLDTFWAGTELDLMGATLTSLDFSACLLHNARFDEARFIGGAGFSGATFTGRASFHSARFAGISLFEDTIFAAYVQFDQAIFTDGWFLGTVFAGGTNFSEATFSGPNGFLAAVFVDDDPMSGGHLTQVHFCWVKLGGPEDMALNIWPSGWTVIRTDARPRPYAPGEWGFLGATSQA